MRQPSSASSRISELFEHRARRFRHASLFVKAVLVALGAFVAGAMQFLQVPDLTKLTPVQAAGIAASVIVFIGAIFVLITEDDASKELAAARQASEEFREAIDELDNIGDYEELIERQIYLYQSMSVMRGCLERAAVLKDGVNSTVEAFMSLTQRTLPVALGFDQADPWTICVYRAVPHADDARGRLICIAHNRAISCDPKNARQWDEGVGVAGIAYANRQEIIVPNMQAAGLGTIFNIASGARDYDADRYRSIAAVPIKVDGTAKPWGIVVATNDRYGHFNLDEVSGLQTTEAVRLLAGMVALAAVVCTEDWSLVIGVQGGLSSGGPNGGNA